MRYHVEGQYEDMTNKIHAFSLITQESLIVNNFNLVSNIFLQQFSHVCVGYRNNYGY